MTALNLYFQQHWQWPILHSAPAPDKFSPESMSILKKIIFGELQEIQFKGVVLNDHAMKNKSIESTIIGGNLSLVQASIGTSWQINAKDKIIFLEDVGEKGYRIDRMLEHLRQASIFKGVAAVLSITHKLLPK